RTIKTIKAGVLSQLTAVRQLMFATLDWKKLVDDRFIIAGGPETVRQQMEEMIRSLRVGHVFCLLHMGNMRDEVTRHSTKLFAEKVMPTLRNLWPDYATDDRFWIKPLAGRRQPEKTLAGAAAGGAR
ncbi:MAG TPA: flavin-dependent oxidoreductase, partial [Candidatus Kryptonia bacterium]|nr:flavin-dependent oxidoreductase [Candidatus Kryptonia bacterium]